MNSRYHQYNILIYKTVQNLYILNTLQGHWCYSCKNANSDEECNAQNKPVQCLDNEVIQYN